MYYSVIPVTQTSVLLLKFGFEIIAKCTLARTKKMPLSFISVKDGREKKNTYIGYNLYKLIY